MNGSILSIGMYGGEVKLLQDALRQHGFEIPASEVDREFFGPATRQAVQRFQQGHGLTMTGTVDERTDGALDNFTAAENAIPTPPPSGKSAAAIGSPVTLVIPNTPLTGSFPPANSAGMPTTAAAPVPTGSPGGVFIVRGTVRRADGSLMAGAYVRAFDKDLRSEQTLGQAVTDSAGVYEIKYKADKFQLWEKDSADLIVRVFDRDGKLLVSSPLLFNSPAAATVDLMVGGTQYPGQSEYEQLLAAITPLLGGVQLADLTEDDKNQDFSFLAGETGQDIQRIVYLAAAATLAQDTKLPNEAFYGFLRQGLPMELPSLLAQGATVQRFALEKSLRANIIPLGLGARVDSIIASLQLLSASAPGRPSTPQGAGATDLVRLDAMALGKTLLDNLDPGSTTRAPVNDRLNAALKGKLAAAFASEGQPDIAQAIQKMEPVDIAANQDVTVRAFADNHVRAQVQGDTAVAEALEPLIDLLSGSTTIGDLLGLNKLASDHPLFQSEVRKAEIASLLATSPLGAANQQDKFISLYAAHEGSNEDFWTKLRQDPAFKAPGTVEDLQFTFQLGLLTLNNAPLVKALRKRPELKSPRDLVEWDTSAWAQLIQSPVDGQAIAVPDGVPGAAPEERAANYIGGMMGLVKEAFPTAVIAQSIVVIPDIDLSLVNAVLARNPSVEPGKRLPAGVDLSGLKPDDQVRAKASMEALRQEIKMFPAFDYRPLLAAGTANGSSRARSAGGAKAFQNPMRDGVSTFLASSEDFDFQTTHVDSYVSTKASTAFNGVPDANRPAVIDQLKRMQRVFRVSPDWGQINALMREGFDSASSIAAVSQARFVAEFGDKLGGQQQAIAVYSTAQHVAAAATALYTQVHQALNDVIPRVIAGGV